MLSRIRLSLVAWLIFGSVESLLAQDADMLIDDLLDLDDPVVMEVETQHVVEVDAEIDNAFPPSQVNESMTPISNESLKVEHVESSPPSEEILVKSSLESMPIDELEAICRQRGFALEGDNLQHADYVEAAKRCLSLEDEINAILAENPELAAELESEIERMAKEKDRLERERDVLLAEKEALEAKLEAAGAGVPISATSGRSGSTETLPYDPTSSIDVFRHSCRLLWTRVGADMRFVGKVMHVVVLKPGAQGVSFVWRYASPSVENGLKKVMAVCEGLLGQESLQSARHVASRLTRMSSQCIRSHAVPFLVMTRSRIMEAAVVLNQQDPICKVTAVVGAVIGPPFEGLVEGWKSAKPSLIDARTNFTAWFSRLKSESHQHHE